MPNDPESLGTGLGPLLADYVPLLPSGARRSGAARVMAARIGYDPSFLVKNPIKTQLLALGAGAIGNALTRKNSTDVTVAATIAPILLVQALRRHELKKIQRKYDEEDRDRLRKLDTDELFDAGWGGGSSRLGAVTAYETMRKRKYRGYGSLAESGDALQLAAGLVHPALYPASIPVISGVDNSAADRMLKKKGTVQLLKALPQLFKAAPKTLGNVGGRVGNFLTAAKLRPGYKDFRAARKTFDFVSPKSMPGAAGNYGMKAVPKPAMNRGLSEMKREGYRGIDGWYRPPNLAKGQTRGLAVVNPYRLPKGREFGPAIRNAGRHEITHGYQDVFSAQGKNFPIWNTAAKGMTNSRHSPLQVMVMEGQALGAGRKGLLAGAKELVRSAPAYGRRYGGGSKAYALPWDVLGMLGRPKALAAAVGGGIGVGVGNHMLRKKGAAQLLGKGIKAFRGLAVKSTPKATRIPAGSSIPTSMAEKMEKVMEVNSRISGRRGYGALKSVDDVSRKNPHMSYMGSFERSLPWAKGPKGATPVLDAFHVGPKGAVTTGGREMSPMAMRQRWRTGYDTKGKAIYDKSAEEVLMQPMYRSSGTGSGTSSAEKWVPFDKYYAPHHSKKYVDQLANTRGMDPAQAAYYRRNMPVSDLIKGTDGLSPWVGKYANTVGADGRIVRESLVHKDDVVRGVFNQQYSKEGLPRHLEGVQELMNNYYGGLSKMGASQPAANTPLANMGVSVGQLSKLDKIRNWAGRTPHAGPSLEIPGLKARGQREIDPRKAPRFSGLGIAQNPDGTLDWNGLSKLRGAEERGWTGKKGTGNPGSYSGAFGDDTPIRPGSYTKEDFPKYFTDYANKVRPEHLSVTGARGNDQAYAQPGGSGKMWLGGHSAGGDRNQVTNAASPSTAVHELTHTMQPGAEEWPDGGDSQIQAAQKSEFETPAVLAGSSVDALKNYHSGNPSGWLGLTSTQEMKEKGWAYPDAATHMVANQAAKHLYGKNIDTWKDTGPAYSMNEALATTEGRQFIKMLGTPRSALNRYPVDPPAYMSGATPLNMLPLDAVARNPGLELSGAASKNLRRMMGNLKMQAPDLDWNAANQFIGEMNPTYQPKAPAPRITVGGPTIPPLPKPPTNITKKADFSEQRNSPALPLYILAALASSAGMAGARQWAHTEGGNTPPLAKEKWPELIRSISGTSPAVYSAPGMNNAFFAKPRTESEALAFMRHADRWEDLTPKSPDVGFVSPYRKKMDRVRRLLRHGAVAADSNSGAPTLAHEGGHAKIEETPGILRALQRHVYPHSRWVAPLAGAGSMAAGLASGGPLKGALLGTGIGALAGLGMVGPEAGASWNAAKGLKGYEGGAHTGHTGKDLLSALSTYLAATVLPSTLSGAAGGYIAGRRKKKEEESEIGGANE